MFNIVIIWLWVDASTAARVSALAKYAASQRNTKI